MDVYLSQETRQSLRALNLMSSKSSGYLIGHKRGNRFFIEKIFSCSINFPGSIEKHIQLNKIFEDKLIGFFSFNTDDKKKKTLLAPFFTGKLFLEIKSDKQKTPSIIPYVIEYENEFFLKELKCLKLN